MDQPTASGARRGRAFDSASVPSVIANEPQFVEGGTLGGNCTSALPPAPCTLTMTASVSGLCVSEDVGAGRVDQFAARPP